MNSHIEQWPSQAFKDFRDLLLRLRFIDRDHLPDTEDWDDDWTSFRDDPYRYFMVAPDVHQRDIWQALMMDKERFDTIKANAVQAAIDEAGRD